jgi:hypothetical protein
VRRSLPRRGDRSQSTGSRCQHHRSPGGGSTRRRWRNTPWRRLGPPAPLCRFHWFNSPGRPRCKAIAADPSTTCRPGTQPLHSASPRRSQCVAPVCSVGTFCGARDGVASVRVDCSQSEGPRQMNGPSSARRQHVWRTSTPRRTTLDVQLLVGNHEVPRNGRASQLPPRRCQLPPPVR